MEAEFIEFVDRRVEKSLQISEMGEPACDVRVDPAAPPMPEPELKTTEVKCVRSQFPEGDADCAAAGAAVAKKRAGNEIVGIHGHPTSHRP